MSGDPYTLTDEEIIDELDAMGFDVDEMYECRPIPDDYPRTRRAAIVAGWLVFIAFLVYAAYEWRVFL